MNRYRIPVELYREARRLAACDGFPLPRTRPGWIALYAPDPKLYRRFTKWKCESATWDEIIALRKQVPPFYRGKIEEVK